MKFFHFVTSKKVVDFCVTKKLRYSAQCTPGLTEPNK